ncbi:uncharacterized protein LOC120203059 [Hibiscus syriacus]|uniref:uncharacterized protein LOC120203059 n=1 Tax=Hibiscus syriacus TaxID=106335 RepID=UPI001924837D|nr:uncharacterized protein LOC120203059 [Hibiscus syriacus]
MGPRFLFFVSDFFYGLVIEEGIADWNHALVGQFIGVAPRFASLQRIIVSILGKSSQVKVSLAGPNLYVFSFTDANLRDWVLDNGPWHIQNKPLVLRRWEPGLQRLNFDLALMPIWVQLYNILLELYTQKGLSYIDSALGNPLFMDSITASRERLEFAKLCVEIDVGSVLPDVIHVMLKDGTFVEIEVHVPWMPQSCATCKVFGHHVSSCTKIRQTSIKPKEVQVWRKKEVTHSDETGSKEPLFTIVEATHEKLTSSSDLKDHNGDSSGLVSNLGVEGVVKPSEFPSLQDSLKKKTRGKKKENIGSSSKVGNLVDGPRKTRAASIGVALLLNEIKAKKRDYLDKVKSNVVSLGPGCDVHSSS